MTRGSWVPWPLGYRMVVLRSPHLPVTRLHSANEIEPSTASQLSVRTNTPGVLTVDDASIYAGLKVVVHGEAPDPRALEFDRTGVEEWEVTMTLYLAGGSGGLGPGAGGPGGGAGRP